MTATKDQSAIAALLNLTATTEAKQTPVTSAWPDGVEIPTVIKSFVQLALSDPNKRVSIAVTPEHDIPMLHAGLKIVAAEMAPDLELHARPRKNKEGVVTEFNFSLGAKRGKKVE